jgi:hypothetical protein
MRRKLLIAGGVVLTGAEVLVVAKRRGRLLAIDTVVRCNQGHLYTTYWIPGVSVKSFRLGPWRIQRCPVGDHWALVTPADEAGLDAGEREAARQLHDLRLP